MSLQLVATLLLVGSILAPSLAVPLWEEGEAQAVLQVIRTLLASGNHGRGVTQECEDTITNPPPTPPPSAKTCAEAGFTKGCCELPRQNHGYKQCWVPGGDCYCHRDCYYTNNCCPDIEEIGCANYPRNCAEAGYKGCCVKATDDHTCWVHGGKCFCDAECYTEGRCCPDIQAVGCSTASTCAEAGHTNGCCQINTTVYECWVPGGDCYCDVGCHVVHNCCPDILETKCFAPALTCRGAGYNGCCDKNTDDDTCFVYFGFCFCDRDCHKRGDCCTDIYDIGCRPGNGTVDSLLNNQATEKPHTEEQIHGGN